MPRISISAISSGLQTIKGTGQSSLDCIAEGLKMVLEVKDLFGGVVVDDTALDAGKGNA